MKRAVALAAILVSGCAPTPYQKNDGWDGGYTNKSLGDGMWSIQVDVNQYTSQGTAMEYAYRRAKHLCPGGFSKVDGGKTQSTSYLKIGRFLDAETTSHVSLIVQCDPDEDVEQARRDEIAELKRSRSKASAPKSADAEPDSAEIRDETESIYLCATGGDGTCWETKTECMAAGGGCMEVRPPIWCANYIDVDGRSGKVCSVSKPTCTSARGLPTYALTGRNFTECKESK